MKRVFLALMALACGIWVSGCATIVSGTTQKLNVTTQPSGAMAKVDNNITAKTPAVFTLERKSDHTIEISMEGYKTATVLIKRTFNGMATGNILLGGIIGGGVDAASGATNKLVPERVDLILEEGTGYSDVPRFASVKDAEYYQKSIIKGSRQTVETTPSTSKDSSTSGSAIATSNFSPKPTAV